MTTGVSGARAIGSGTDRRSRPDSVSSARALGLVSGIGVSIAVSFASVYPLRGLRVVNSTDAPVYVWWARRAATLGLSASQTGSRPATIAVLATLSGALHVPTSAAVEGIGPALAATVGLAMAAFVGVSLGGDRLRFCVVALLTGGYVSLLAIGFYATLAFGAMFVGSLACLVLGAQRRALRPWMAATVLLGVAGLAHPVFIAIGAPLLAIGAVALLRPSTDRAQGWTIGAAEAAYVGSALVGGAAILGIGLVAAGSHHGRTIDINRDAANRRLGLGSHVISAFRDTLISYAPQFTVGAIGAGVAGIPIFRGRGAKSSIGRRFHWAIQLGWIAMTAFGLVLLLAGSAFPGQRLASFCLSLPAVAGIGIALAWRRNILLPRSMAGVLLVVTVGSLFLLFWSALWRSARVSAEPLVEEAHALGKALASEPPGTVLVLVMDDLGPFPGRTLTRTANFVRDELPPARSEDLYLFVGTPSGLQSGRPSLTGGEEHDRISRDAWMHLAPVLRSTSWATVLADADADAYRQATAVRGAVSLGPGTVVFRPEGAAPPPTRSEREVRALTGAFTRPGDGPRSPWTPVWLAPSTFALMTLVGLAWASSLGIASALIRSALAPALGLSALALAGMVVDAAGFRLEGGGAIAAVMLALGVGLLARAARSPGTPT